eukprot:2059581-Prymnesium_polylepis.1
MGVSPLIGLTNHGGVEALGSLCARWERRIYSFCTEEYVLRTTAKLRTRCPAATSSPGALLQNHLICGTFIPHTKRVHSSRLSMNSRPEERPLSLTAVLSRR